MRLLPQTLKYISANDCICQPNAKLLAFKAKLDAVDDEKKLHTLIFTLAKTVSMQRLSEFMISAS